VLDRAHGSTVHHPLAGLPSGAERALTVTRPAVLTAGRLRRRSGARTFCAGR
jgi:hypothetical protein